MSLKLLICLAIFTLLAVTAIWIIQVLLSNTLYANAKQREVELTAETLEEKLRFDKNDIQDSVAKYAEKYGMGIKIYSVNNGKFTEYCSAIGLMESFLTNIKDDNIRFYYIKAFNSGGVCQEQIPHGVISGDDASDMDDVEAVSIYAEVVNCGDREYLMLINTLVTPKETIRQTIFAQFSYIIFFLIIGTLATAFLLSKVISKPLSGMNESAKQLAAGNYDVDFNVGGYREISELSETLNYAARELSKNDHLQKELIANISHDLRTPLTMIKGYGEVMRDIPGENTPENIQAIIDETERLSELVNDLLDLSKIESGTKEFVPEKFDLTDAVNKVISRYDRMNSVKGYNIDFEYDDAVTVKADSSMILQVIYNLINNAINYCGDDLYVGVKQTVGVDKNGKDIVRISVTDHGQGIAPDQLHVIWDRYYKVDKVHHRAEVGTGLGLSIVKKILMRHGASYGVESTVGEGSTFWFELPISK